MLRSVALMLRHGIGEPELADELERAVGEALESTPTPDLGGSATTTESTDAVVRVTRACICGSDLWPYASMEPSDTGQSMGHEAIGVVEDVGAEVRTVKPGDAVVMPFAFSDGTCAFCHEGLNTACVHVGFFGNNGMNGAQAEALRVPYADGTLFPLPVGEDHALMPSLLTLSDVLGTGHHAAVVAKVETKEPTHFLGYDHDHTGAGRNRRQSGVGKTRRDSSGDADVSGVADFRQRRAR